MLYEVRLQKIRELVKKTGSIKTVELQKMLSVSEMTIRRDLANLEQEGFIKRVFGGAMLADGTEVTVQETTFTDRKIANLNFKENIARYAVTLIEKNASIYLDGSTTCNELAKILPEDLNLTVFTNSLEVLMDLRYRKGISIVSLGGELALDGNTLDGTLAIENAEKLMVDICFFSGRGFTPRIISNAGMIGTIVKNVMLKNAKKRYFLADSTKYEESGVIELCKWDIVDLLITDKNLSVEAKDSLTAKGIAVKAV